MSMSSMLRHLSAEDQKKVEEIDTKIYELQGSCQCMKDTETLAILYSERLDLIEGRS